MLYTVGFVILACIAAGGFGWLAERRRRADLAPSRLAGAVELSGHVGRARGLRRWFGRQPALVIPPGVCAAVIPAHNEEAVIAATLRSVVQVWQREDVFVFCDNCSDRTAEIARRYLPEANVLVGERQFGKSRGLEHVLSNHVFPREYVYVSVIDADTTVDPAFLQNTLQVLRYTDIACAVGQVRSRWHANNLISVYRTYVYTLWQLIYKRLQSYTNSVTIASGCSTTWKTRVLKQLTFDHRMSTEDFSLTMQVHRQRLGKIKYVPSAVVATQDPFTIDSYQRQMYRWDRAWWESVRRYQVGLRWFHMRNGLPTGVSVLDISTVLLTLDIAVYMLTVLALPVLLIHPVQLHVWFFDVQSRSAVLHLFAWQYGSVLLTALVVSFVTRRPRVLYYSPLFLFLLYVDIIVTFRAVGSTVRSQYQQLKTAAGNTDASIWTSPERRQEV
ncbi:MAG TPA: glycosyltransferase family 2 protein [Dehalococcoidia bacterium]|nr:glycosyltransferase family 2 protein [Dehalococcoidia bacterium]